MKKVGTLTIFFGLLLFAVITAVSCGVEDDDPGIVIVLTSPTPVATTAPPAITPPTRDPDPAPEAVAPESPAEPEPEPGDLSPLQTLFEQELAGYTEHWVSACVTDLQTSQTVCIDGDSQRDTGCVIDLFALFVAVEEFEAGRASPDDWVEYYDGNPVGLSVASLIRAGIGSSSPNHAAIFLSAVKGDSLAAGTFRAREIVAELGLENTIFGYVPYNPIEADFPPNLATARDVNRALTKLWSGEIFSPEWTAYTIDVLTASEYTSTMPDLVRWKDAHVAHKIGYFGYESGYNFAVWNDSGIVYWEKDGKQIAFALSVFTQGPWAGKSIVASLADTSFDYFNAEY